MELKELGENDFILSFCFFNGLFWGGSIWL